MYIVVISRAGVIVIIALYGRDDAFFPWLRANRPEFDDTRHPEGTAARIIAGW